MKSYVDSTIATMLGNIVIEGGEDVTQSVVNAWIRAWMDSVYQQERDTAINNAITQFKNNTLQSEIMNVAGNVVQTGLGQYDINVASLHLAAGVASLLINKGIVDDSDPNKWDIDPVGIIVAINGDDNTSATSIRSDKIVLDGDTIANAISSTSLNINNGNTKLNSDGSGYIANGGISWNAAGQFTNLPEYTQFNDISIHGADIDACDIHTLDLQATKEAGDVNPTLTGMYLVNGGYRYRVIIAQDGTLKADFSNPIAIS